MPTPKDVLDRFRLEVDDPEIPGDDDPLQPDADSLWKNSEIYGYMDEAQALLARRALLLTGNLELAFTADDPLVALPPEVVELRRAKVRGERFRFTLLNLNEMAGATREDYGVSGLDDWEDVTGPPRIGITDHTPDNIRLVPVPTEAGTLDLNAFVEPEEAIVNGTSTLTLQRREYTRAILHWMKKLAYEKQDADVLDLERARGFELQFYAAADEIKSEQRRRTRRAGTVRYGGL